MSRFLSAERRTIFLQMLRGDIDSNAAASQLGVSRKSAIDLKRRYLRSKMPKIYGEVSAPVDQPVSILRDRWGVAHIEASSLRDAYTALGYAMAQDRLWHLDYMRRLAHGRVAEVLGPRFLHQDRLHRTLGLTVAAKNAATAMSAEVASVLQAMTLGINAGIEVAQDNLPIEFELLAYAPEPWTPVDSIAIWKWRWWMLTGRLEVLAQREAIHRFLPPDLVDLFLSLEADDETIVPADEPAAGGGFDTGEGSNNWVVGASRSTSGKPILATDPHNGVDLAQQWYQAQVKCPDIDAIGAFFMGTPGIYLGHTRRSAWGVTNHTASARDLYVETVSKDDPDLYLENGRWLRFAIEQQEIPVRGQAADLLEIRQTVRGPVLSAFVPTIDEGPPPVLSLRWVGAEPTTGFESMLALMRSQSAAEIERALRIWPFPILNMLFADTDGHIGYRAVGRVPKQRASPYGFKRADDPDHRWTAMYEFDQMPQLIDPERDWLASANNPPWGGWGSYMRSGNWSDGYRFRRIRTRIEARNDHSIESVGAIQADVLHGRAQALAPIVAQVALAGPNKAIRKLGEILRDWDGSYTTDSIGPTVFTAFWEKWLLRVTRVHFPERIAQLVASKAGSVAGRVLLGEDPGWFPSDIDLHRELIAALRDALEWLRAQVGPRRSQWRWGRVHTVHFTHPASTTPTLAALLDLGPFETSGGTGTVRAAGASMAHPFVVTSLSTYRMVVDLANPTRSLATAAGGQSGHPASPHYRTQTKLWIEDQYHPLLMDRADIEANLDGLLVLNPG